MKLVLLGDIALFGILSKRNNSNIEIYFKDIADYLSIADYVIGNLETPFSVKQKTNGAKSAYIYSDVENVEILKYLHIDAVTLANNHIFDYGKEGYETTKQLLKENGIEYFGSEGKSVRLTVDENKLSLHGFCCYSTNPLNAVQYGRYGVNAFNTEVVKELFVNDKEDGYLSILSVHAGLEHVNYPSLDSVSVARTFASYNDYIYYGHHPHVAQGIEMHKSSLIAYSLGNFCFDDVYTSVSKAPLVKLSENNRSSYVLEVDIRNNKIFSYKIVPIYIGKDKLHINKGVDENTVKHYTSKINQLSTEEYNKLRSSLLNEYYAERRKKRNIYWYLKRLRLRYAKLLVAGYNNSRLYKKNIKIS